MYSRKSFCREKYDCERWRQDFITEERPAGRSWWLVNFGVESARVVPTSNNMPTTAMNASVILPRCNMIARP